MATVEVQILSLETAQGESTDFIAEIYIQGKFLDIIQPGLPAMIDPNANITMVLNSGKLGKVSFSMDLLTNQAVFLPLKQSQNLLTQIPQQSDFPRILIMKNQVPFEKQVLHLICDWKKKITKNFQTKLKALINRKPPNTSESSLLSVLQMKDTQICQLQSANQELQAQIAFLKQKLPSVPLNKESQLNQKIQSYSQNLQRENKLLEKRLNNMRDKLTQKEEQIQEKSKQIDQLQSQSLSLKTELIEALEDIKVYDQQTKVLQCQNLDLKRQVEEFQSTAMIAEILEQSRLSKKFLFIKDSLYKYNGRSVELVYKDSDIQVKIGGGLIPLHQYIRLFSEEPLKQNNLTPRAKSQRVLTPKGFNNTDNKQFKFGDQNRNPRAKVCYKKRPFK